MKEGLTYDNNQKFQRQLQGSMLPVRIHSDQAMLFRQMVCRMPGACSSPSLWWSLRSHRLHRLHHVCISISPISILIFASWSVWAISGAITERFWRTERRSVLSQSSCSSFQYGWIRYLQLLYVIYACFFGIAVLYFDIRDSSQSIQIER